MKDFWNVDFMNKRVREKIKPGDKNGIVRR